MQDVQTFPPNWQPFYILLSSFACCAAALYVFFDIGVIFWVLFCVTMLTTFFYLLHLQNYVELSHQHIHQHFVLPWRAAQHIDISKIDWIALDKRRLFRFNTIKRSSVIIKLKDDRLFTINLLLLKNKADLEGFFLTLSDTLEDHNKELFKMKDMHGFSQLAIDATLGLTDLVEAMHQNLSRLPGMQEPESPGKTSGITGLVYKNIKAITSLAGSGIDGLLAQISPLLSNPAMNPSSSSVKQNKQVSFEPAAVLSALNGVLGDYLVSTHNPMAIAMRFRRGGHSLKLNSTAISEALHPLNGKLLVLVHGLCMNDLQWQRKGHDHGEALARELGYTPIYLRYNTGQHISVNGRAFADLLDMLVKLWPVSLEEIVIIGHSMGGLVTRSAVHYGTHYNHSWFPKLRKMLFLGSPHHGAPLERGGNWVDTILGSTPYTAPLARLGKVRSSGITDLRYGNIIDEHWQGQDRFERTEDKRKPVPLPEKVQCYTIAGTTGSQPGDVIDQLLGDGLVQVSSALGQHKKKALCLNIPKEHQWIGPGINHMELLNHPEVYQKIKHWLS